MYAFLNFCAQISRPLAYGVRISSKASATVENAHAGTPFVFGVFWLLLETGFETMKRKKAVQRARYVSK